jgi:hypothetical protein
VFLRRNASFRNTPTSFVYASIGKKVLFEEVDGAGLER